MRTSSASFCSVRLAASTTRRLLLTRSSWMLRWGNEWHEGGIVLHKLVPAMSPGCVHRLLGAAGGTGRLVVHLPAAAVGAQATSAR